MEEQGIENEKPKEEKIQITNRCLEDYKEWLQDQKYSLNTAKSYFTLIEKVVGNRKYISSQLFKSFIKKGKCRRMKAAAFKNFKNFMLDKYEIIIKEFFIPRIKKEQRVKSQITLEEVNKLIKAMPTDHHKLLLKIILGGGLRLGEAIQIWWEEDFKWKKWNKDQEDLLELLIKKAKKNKQRIVFLDSNLGKEIWRYIEVYRELDKDCKLLFDYSEPGYNAYISKQIRGSKKNNRPPVSWEIANFRYMDKSARTFRKLIHKAGVEVLEREDIHSHLIRHLYLTNLDELGVPLTMISSLAGHSNINTTKGYIHNSPQKIKETLRRLNKK